jgi:hypothetical protein
MSMTSPAASLVHATARLCPVPVPQALAHLSEQAGMARWILGLWDCREVGEGLFAGASLFDGAQGFVRVVVDAARGEVDYWVGAEPQALARRIRATVLAGESLGHPAGTSLVTLEAWRTAGMDDARWARLQITHETEIELIRAQLGPQAGSH